MATEEASMTQGFSDEQKAKLSAGLDRSLVKERKERGTKLSYIEHHVVTRELNAIFGPDRWDLQVKYVKHFDPHPKEGRNGPQLVATAEALCRLEVRNEAGILCKVSEDVGYGVAFAGEANYPSCIEQAGKSAVSDGLKRCAYKLGDALGLALYDTTQQRVVDSSTLAASASLDDKKVKAIQDAVSITELMAIHRGMSNSERPAYQKLLAARKAELGAGA